MKSGRKHQRRKRLDEVGRRVTHKHTHTVESDMFPASKEKSSLCLASGPETGSSGEGRARDLPLALEGEDGDERVAGFFRLLLAGREAFTGLREFVAWLCGGALTREPGSDFLLFL